MDNIFLNIVKIFEKYQSAEIIRTRKKIVLNG